MPKVSVIVPVYNAEAFLPSCLDSLTGQSLGEVEIVLVDDHGPDDSMAVAHRYAEGYSGPKTFVFAATPRNSGPGAARNVGLSVASGEFVAFVDADDTVSPDFCSALWDAASAVHADMAYCHIRFDYSDGRPSVVGRNPLVAAGEFTSAKKKYYLRHYVSYFTTYIYRRQMLLDFGIKFPPTRSAEDSCFLASSLLTAASIAPVDAPMYFYRIEASSVSNKKDPQRYRQRISSFKSLLSFARRCDLYRPYRFELWLIMIKKGYLLALRDLLKNL